jgi:hypothetical protein
MGLRHTPPAITPELLDRFGEPEHVFGPNRRFRVLSAICGFVLVALGIYFVLLEMKVVGRGVPLSDMVATMIAAPLLALGVAAIVLPRRMPASWVVVCPHGLLCTRFGELEGIPWADVDRFEDATIASHSVTFRQCRINLKGGDTRAFLETQIADYPRLAELLQQRLARPREMSDNYR